MDGDTVRGRGWIGSRRGKVALAATLLVASFCLGTAFGRPAQAIAAATMQVFVKNWPSKQKVMIVGRTPISKTCDASMADGVWDSEKAIYTVPAGKMLTVTGVSMDAWMSKTDGRLMQTYFTDDVYRLQLTPVATGEFNTFNLRWYACSQTADWRVPAGTTIHVAAKRDTPGSLGVTMNFYLTGYLTAAP